MTTTIFVAQVTADDGAIQFSKAFFDRNRAIDWANSEIENDKRERAGDEELASRHIDYNVCVTAYEVE